jgi:hypothetical protein
MKARCVVPTMERMEHRLERQGRRQRFYRDVFRLGHYSNDTDIRVADDLINVAVFCDVMLVLVLGWWYVVCYTGRLNYELELR